MKTHKGVHTELHRLTRHDDRVAPDLRAFVDIAYNLKTAADYDVTPGSEVSPAEARAALATARRFVAKMAELIGSIQSK